MGKSRVWARIAGYELGWMLGRALGGLVRLGLRLKGRLNGTR